jgi:hypothetical protein
MSSMEAGIHWFIAREGRQHGPVSDMEMRKLVELGHLRHTDLLWRQGFPDWRPAPTVFAGNPAPAPAPVATHYSEPRTYQNGASPSVMPRFEQTSGRGAQGNAAEMAAAVAQAHGSFISQRNGGGASGDARANPQFVPMQAPQKLNEPRLEAQSASSYREVSATTEFSPPPKKGAAGAVMAIAVVMALLGGGWYVIKKHGGKISEIVASRMAAKDPASPTETPAETQALAPAEAPATAVTEKPAATSAETPPTATVSTATITGAAPAETAAPNTPATAVPVATTPPPTPEQLAAVGSELEKTPYWKLISTEFPDWYRERVASAAAMNAGGKSQAEVSKFLVQSLVELRRSQADAALGASTETLKSLAVAFKASVTQLSKIGTPTCMAFIMSGESHDSVVSVISDPAKNTELNAHLLAVFTAVSEGRKGATAHADPADGDYKLLVQELVKKGWTQAELELFADPKGASRTTPERYCQMMQDFFAAHLTITDPNVQDRLLHRTLKLVVAG